jgi:photosystem II stability/assembly factor-like uncharacterized protein
LITAAGKSAGVGGGEGGQVIYGLATDSSGNFMLMGTDVSGFFRSLDGGSHWQPSNVGILGTGTRAIAIDPHNSMRALIIASSNGYGENGHGNYGGIYLSVDQGESWTQKVAAQVGAVRDVNEVAYDPSSRSGGITSIAYWFASPAAGGGLRKTINGGATWSTVNSSYSGPGSVAVHPTMRYVYIGNANGFYRSTDGGKTFTKRYTAAITGISVSKVQPNFVAITTSGNLVLSSTDAGVTFSRCTSSGLPTTGHPYGIKASPVNSKYLAVVYDTGRSWDQHLYYSHDGGSTWAGPTAVSSPGSFFRDMWQDVSANARAWSPTNQNVLFSAGNWVMKSTDGGAHITWYNDGNNGVDVVSRWVFNPFNPNLILMSAQDWGIAFSKDGGSTWKNLTRTMAYGAYAFSSTRLFSGKAATWMGTRTLYTSGDGGNTWTSTGLTSDNRIAPVSADPGDANTAFWNQYRTRDQGHTWSTMSGGVHSQSVACGSDLG